MKKSIKKSQNKTDASNKNLKKEMKDRLKEDKKPRPPNPNQDNNKKNIKNKIDQYDFSERLKYLRQRRNYSQVELAQKSDLSQATIAQIESGRKDPSIMTLKKLAHALDIHPAIFFASDDVHIFDMNRLRSRYNNVADLNATLYRAIGEVIRYAKEIGFM